MTLLNLKSSSKVVRTYYQELSNLSQLHLFSDAPAAVSPAFAALLRYCANQFNWTLSEQHTMRRGKGTIRPDGVLLEGGEQVLDLSLDSPHQLVMGLKVFFEYEPPALEEWERAIEEFKEIVPDLAQKLLFKIREEGKRNKRFIAALAEFTTLCQEALNPNISSQAIEEMLIQHLLTERIFNRVLLLIVLLIVISLCHLLGKQLVERRYLDGAAEAGYGTEQATAARVRLL